MRPFDNTPESSPSREDWDWNSGRFDWPDHIDDLRPGVETLAALSPTSSWGPGCERLTSPDAQEGVSDPLVELADCGSLPDRRPGANAEPPLGPNFDYRLGGGWRLK